MSQSHKKHKKHKVWPEALSMYKARRLLAAFSILAQFLQLEWHCKPDFLDYLLCFLRGFYPCSWRSCKGPVEPHQIFSFPTWSPLWIQVATAQGNVAQRVHLWYVRKKMPGKPLVMYGQVSVDLAHAKAEFDEQFRSLWIQGHLTWVLFQKFLKRAVQFQHCLDFVVPRTRIIHPLCPKVQKQWAKGLDLSTFPSQFWWTFLLLEHAQFRKASIPGCNLMLGIELNHKIPNQLQVAARFLVGHQLENQEPQNTSKLHTINTQVFAVEPANHNVLQGLSSSAPSQRASTLTCLPTISTLASKIHFTHTIHAKLHKAQKTPQMVRLRHWSFFQTRPLQGAVRRQSFQEVASEPPVHLQMLHGPDFFA